MALSHFLCYLAHDILFVYEVSILGVVSWCENALRSQGRQVDSTEYSILLILDRLKITFKLINPVNYLQISLVVETT